MVIIDLINHGSELAVKRARCFLFFFGLAARDKILTPLASLKMQLIDSASPRRINYIFKLARGVMYITTCRDILLT